MNEVVRENVVSYIEKYEPQFVLDLGIPQPVYQELCEYAGLETQDDEDKNRILKLLRFSLSHYVAYWYFRSQTNSPIGGVELASENGNRVSLNRQVTLVWNQMVANNSVLVNELGAVPPDNQLLKEVNLWNL